VDTSGKAEANALADLLAAVSRVGTEPPAVA